MRVAMRELGPGSSCQAWGTDSSRPRRSLPSLGGHVCLWECGRLVHTTAQHHISGRAVAQGMQHRVEPAGIVDGLRVPDDIVLAALAVLVVGILDGLAPLVAVGRGEHEDQGEGGPCEGVRSVERQHVLEAERCRHSEETHQLVEDIWVGLERDEVFAVRARHRLHLGGCRRCDAAACDGVRYDNQRVS